MKKIFGLFLIFPLIAMAGVPQMSCEELFDPIMKTLKDNSAEDFSKYFADAVEIDFFGKNTIYSKVQSEQIVKDFFERKAIKQITLKHCSGKEYLKYAVISITDLGGLLYRATIFIRIENDGKVVVQEIRMEKQE
ncbi:MAG: DUF4783 domain-containing protein [Prevotellaceae bacterium]|jgi:hypothetical protein|nr:DUF4783 domain-containing protein [Prevotellaceae bacterium]